MDAQEKELNLTRDMDWIRNYVNAVVKRVGYCEKAFDMEDMYQEASLAYLMACDTYDGSKDAALKTYASKKIYWVLTDFMRGPYMSAVKKEQFAGLTEGYAESCGQHTEYTFKDAEDRAYMEPFDEIFYRVYKQKKSKCVRYGILALRAEILGHGKHEIAEELGVKTNYLSVCRKRALEALQPYMGEIRALLD